jgi:putative ABC transport system ATP-binding protein
MPEAGQPLLLPTDEPTRNLYSHNEETILELLQNSCLHGADIRMVTHDARFAEQTQGEVHLFDGKVVAEEERKKLMADVQA